MKTILVFPNPYPIGGASTQRITHVASSIFESGIDCEIIISKGTEKKGKIFNTKINGTYKNIAYRYIHNSTSWPHSIAGRLFNYYFGLFKLLILLLRKLKKGDITILYADYKLITNLLCRLVISIKKAKYILLVDEFPWCVIHKYKYSRLYKWIYPHIYYRTFDGIITMTTILKKYYQQLSSKKCMFFHYPMSVDCETFNSESSEETDYSNLEYMAYAGGDTNGYDKDGVKYIIDAFKIVSIQYPQLKLLLIGNFSEDRYSQVSTLNLSDRVIFTGYIHYRQVISIIKSAKVLIMAKVNNIQNQGCFSTKLGEYLLSGNPIVLTNTGEMDLYFNDGVNAFISDSVNAKSLASKIIQVLDNYTMAKKVGHQGYITALQFFDYKRNISAFKRFLKRISD